MRESSTLLSEIEQTALSPEKRLCGGGSLSQRSSRPLCPQKRGSMAVVKRKERVPTVRVRADRCVRRKKYFRLALVPASPSKFTLVCGGEAQVHGRADRVRSF